MSGPGFFDTLERQLGTGFDRATSRRVSKRRIAERVGGVALGLVALVATVTIVLGEEPAAAGVDVELRGGLVYVRLTDVEYRADVIEHAAAGAGLDITVEEIASGPSFVGRFIGYTQTGEDPGELRQLNRDGPAFSGFTIPAGYEGSLVLQVGRPAADGEPYALFANALADGEPLACSGILGATPRQAMNIADGRHVDVRWAVVSAQGTQPVDATEVVDYSGTGVRRVLSIAPDTVIISLGDESVPLPEMELSADAVC